MKKKFALILCAALLAGCTSSTSGSKEEQEVEKFNVIQNDIDNNDFDKAFESMFDDTLEAYNNNIEIDITSTGTMLDPSISADSLDLKLESANVNKDIVSFIQDDVLYIIEDNNDKTMTITRYGSDGGKKITLALDDESATLQSIDAASKDAKTNEERQTDLLASLFDNSDKIPYSPVENPDLFYFTNEDTGTGLMCSIDIRDIPAMNKEAKNTGSEYLELDGVALKDISIDMDYFDILINNEGVIQQITNVVEITYQSESQKQKESYDLTMNVYSYDYSKFNVDKIDAIFDGIDAGSISVGDAVDISD
jgi:hypothetical protein